MTPSKDMSGGKRKKLAKRVAKGECNTLKVYEDCFNAGVTGLPEIHADQVFIKSRQEASFSYDSSELRGLLASLVCGKEALPRSLHIKNRHFIRNVIMLHISDWSDDTCDYSQLRTVLHEVNAERTAAKDRKKKYWPFNEPRCVRVTRHPEKHLLPLLQSLLLVPLKASAQELGIRDARPTGYQSEMHADVPTLDKYKALEIPRGGLQMWGFPISSDSVCVGLQAVQPEILRAVERGLAGGYSGTSGSNTSAHVAAIAPVKRTREEAVTMERTTDDHDCGTLFSLVPSPAEAEAIAKMLPRADVIYGGKTRDGFYSTISASSSDRSVLYMHGSAAPPPHSIIAVDCEMCTTANGAELARLSVVSEDSEVLLDVFVQPEMPVLDYLTQYSGITEEILANARTLTQLQARVAFLRIASAETIICGHSVDSDMKALKMLHYCFVDTAILYTHPKGFPLRLKLSQLAKDYLQLRIQSQSQTQTQGSSKRRKGNSGFASSRKSLVGHDSVEDARTALALVQLKARYGLSFGLETTLATATSTGYTPGIPLLASADYVGDDFEKVTLQRVGVFCNDGDEAMQLQGCLAGEVALTVVGGADETTRQSVEFLKRLPLSDNTATFPQLSLTIAMMKSSALSAASSASSGASPVEQDSEAAHISTASEARAQLKRQIEELLVALEQRSDADCGGGLLIVTAQSSIETVKTLKQRQRLVSTSNTASTWTERDQRQLKETISRANSGVVAFASVE